MNRPSRAGAQRGLSETALELHRQTMHIQADAVRVQDALRQPPRVAGPHPDGGERHPAPIALGKFASKGIADVDDDVPQIRHGEQTGLGGAVGGHGPVVIQMIAGEIGERSGMKTNSRHPVLIEGLRGDFHGHVAHAGGAQLRQPPIQRDHIGSGERGSLERLDPAPADGADVGGGAAQPLETLRQQVGAGGLAVGARDAGDPQLRGGPVEKTIRDTSHQRAQARDARGEHRCRQRRRLHIRAGLPQHHRGAPTHGVGGELQSVYRAPAQCEEQTAAARLAAVERQVVDARVVRGHVGNAVEQPGERGYSWRVRWPEPASRPAHSANRPAARPSGVTPRT